MGAIFGFIPADSLVADTLVIAVLLLPGFLALRIRDGIASTKPRRPSESWLPALLFDLPIYLILLAVAQVERFGLTPTLEHAGFNPWTVLAALGIAVVVGLVAGLLDEKRVVRWVMIKARISRKGWRNAWADSFRAAQGSYANVILKNGTEIYGWPKFFSAGADKNTVFIARGDKHPQPVSILQPGGREFEVEGPGVLITPQAEVTLVQFVDPAPLEEAE